MDCDKAKSLLGWFHDGELNVADRSLVADHVEHCPSCAAELSALIRLDRASRQFSSPEPPPEIWNRIRGELERREQISRRRFLWTAGAFAASLGGVAVSYGLWSRQGPGALPGVPVNRGRPERPLDISVNLASFGPEDRRLVEEQGICASAECDDRLGAEGKPVKIMLEGVPVFVCSHGCEEWARAHPALALAKLRKLQIEHQQLGRDGTKLTSGETRP